MCRREVDPRIDSSWSARSLLLTAESLSGASADLEASREEAAVPASDRSAQIALIKLNLRTAWVGAEA